ncbi:hypothetical protein TWF694_001448 [Orbilia ellipsospora]|uniref:Uncharacterized protein n=1 Tax=Orbilia ellipsospora TaxID=2528407 RepID=A0AAV9XRL5_9PEZI
MKFLSICVLLTSAVVNATVLPRATNDKFQVTRFNMTGSFLLGEAETPVRTRSVEIYWAEGDSWHPVPIRAESRWDDQARGISFWRFSGSVPTATHFYAKASHHDGSQFYAPRDTESYHIKR